MRNLAQRLPLQFRVLYRQFLLRVVDLEALSIQADIPRFLGQFAGVLIMFSMLNALLFLIRADDPTFTAARRLSAAWGMEQGLLSLMMLIAGLIAVVSWDATFPDRRDAMVLSPLPVRPRTILMAKVAASGSILGLAVLALNFASGVAIPLVLGGVLRFLPFLAAYWFTMAAATFFLYGSVLTVQGFTALLLPRRIFLRLSAVLQLAAFGLFLGMYFLQPSLPTPAALEAAGSHRALACLPCFWFFALFNQLTGSLPSSLWWLAWRAWIGLGVVACGAAASLLLCYLRTMKKTVEEPDLVPGARGWHWTPRFGSGLQTAIVLFSVRSLARSRHHRVAFAFYLALVVAIALFTMKGVLSIAAPRPLTAYFLMCTCVMMSLAVLGLRSVFSLPISLNANWVLRITQLRPSEKYIAATRRALVLLAFLPVWLCAALLSLCFRPLYLSAAHLVVLALVGSILVDLSLIGVSKIPFACSYLPGKSNIQYMFWGFLVLFTTVAMLFANFEQRALHHPLQYAWMIGVLGAAALGLWIFNRYRAKSAVLYFEELPPEVITTLGLVSVRPPSQMGATERLNLS
ncbi:MAG: hypothetical protein WA634_06540 [Silvibacterium sp.]